MFCFVTADLIYNLSLTSGRAFNILIIYVTFDISNIMPTPAPSALLKQNGAHLLGFLYHVFVLFVELLPPIIRKGEKEPTYLQLFTI